MLTLAPSLLLEMVSNFTNALNGCFAQLDWCRYRWVVVCAQTDRERGRVVRERGLVCVLSWQESKTIQSPQKQFRDYSAPERVFGVTPHFNVRIGQSVFRGPGPRSEVIDPHSVPPPCPCFSALEYFKSKLFLFYFEPPTDPPPTPPLELTTFLPSL